MNNFVPFFVNSNICLKENDISSFSSFMTSIAGNTGNSYITYSLLKELGVDAKSMRHIQNIYTYNFDNAEGDIEYIKSNCSHIFLVLQDQIRINESYGLKLPYKDIENFIIKCQKPLIVVGLGANCLTGYDTEFYKKLSPDLVNFLFFLSHHSKEIGVRGNFTAEVLQSLGIDNVSVVGCPSFYEMGKNRIIRKSKQINISDIILTSRCPIISIRNNNQICQDVAEESIIRSIAFQENFNSYSNFEIQKQFHLSEFSKEQKEKLYKLVYEKFKNWQPDIIIGVNAVDPIIREIFPKALSLGIGAGIFQLKPFPNSHFLDPVGYVSHCSLYKFYKEIRNFKISEDENAEVENFKTQIYQMVQAHNPLKEILSQYRQKYKYLILFPLVVPDAFVRIETPFKQYVLEPFMNYMNQIPSDIGVIVTEHHCYNFITPEIENLLRKKYPNFIYLKGNVNEQNKISSLFFLPYVDAMVNGMSLLGIQALLFDVKIISQNERYNKCIQDCFGLKNINKVLKQKKENKNNIIYWLLTRYYFLAELFHNNDAFAELIRRRYDYFKVNGVDFEFFDKIISFPKFADFVTYFVQKNGFSLVEQTSASIVLKKVNIF